MKSYTLCCIVVILLVGFVSQEVANGNIFNSLGQDFRHAAGDVAHVAKEGADDVAHDAVKAADDVEHVATTGARDVAKGVSTAAKDTVKYAPIIVKKVDTVANDAEPIVKIIATGIQAGEAIASLA